MSQPGLKVMFNRFCRTSADDEIKKCVGKNITLLELEEDSTEYGEGMDAFVVGFEDGTRLCLWDDGQSCCERRYMTTDDDLPSYVGSTFLDAELREGPETQDEYGETHEVQFLTVKTSGGNVVLSNHNEHNGYYGGFSIMSEVRESND